MLIFLSLILSFSFAQEALGNFSICPDHPKAEQADRHRNYCDSTGELVRIDRLFADPTKVSRSTIFRDGKRVNEKVYNLEQVQTYEADIQELSDGSYIKTEFSLVPLRSYIKKKQKLRDVEGQILPEVSAQWIYEVNESKTDSSLALYLEYREGTKIPLKKAFYAKNGQIKYWEEYILDNPQAKSKLDVRVIGLNKLSADEELIAEYRTEGPVTFDELYGDGAWPLAKPLGVVVVDSGFETDHPDLLPYWFQNPLEKFDGVDNDNNGLVDDVYGVHQEQGGEATNIIRESFLFNDPLRPIFSHGTHVASLAMKNINMWSMAAFSGDYTDPNQLARVGDFIKKHSARFVNMSFSFETPGGAAPPIESFSALESLIKNHEDALYFVAAGNSNNDLDAKAVYPASWSYDNLIVVGALESSEWAARPDRDYATKAKFSSYGEKSADIFAPGTDIQGAFLGLGQGVLSGTSMAAPKALNVVARLAENFMEVNSKDLKAALLLGAYIPDLTRPLPCKSGGVVFESRMKAILKNYQNGMSLEEAAISARLNGKVLEGEEINRNYFSRLKKFWKERELLPAN